MIHVFLPPGEQEGLKVSPRRPVNFICAHRHPEWPRQVLIWSVYRAEGFAPPPSKLAPVSPPPRAITFSERERLYNEFLCWRQKRIEPRFSAVNMRVRLGAGEVRHLLSALHEDLQPASGGRVPSTSQGAKGRDDCVAERSATPGR